MAKIEEIIRGWRSQELYDEELWDFVSRLDGRRLENLTDDELQLRLAKIDKNIQFLDPGPGPRDALPPERGWISPWYWVRLRYWTTTEMALRSMEPAKSPDVPAMPVLKPDFRGIHAGGRKLLVRISRAPFLMDSLERGRLRFAPASSYREIEGDSARSDDEMRKGYRRPSSALSINLPDGQPVVPIGDVNFTTHRTVGNGSVEVPYWLISYSTDLDPRLFSEFQSAEGDDAVMVVFDVEQFLKRALPHLNRAAALSEKLLHQINYYDAYCPPSQSLSPLTFKDMRFAYQREFRFILDPGQREQLADGDVLFVDIGSIADIAGVYEPDGRRVGGAGPDSYFA